MNILIAPDSFKGSMTSSQFCAAAKEILTARYPNSNIYTLPMADGGEGTCEALVSATDGRFVSCDVTGPLGKKISTRFGVLGNRFTAVIEMASASGLPLVPKCNRNPFVTTSRGTGELIEAALDLGCTMIIIGIGGSATNDGGAGMLMALGADMLSQDGTPISDGAIGLKDLKHIDASKMDTRLFNTRFLVACDVDAPLCGKQGASAVFAPQKGAVPEDIPLLDSYLYNFGEIIRRDLGKDVFVLPGGGAAGGMGAGLMAFLNAELYPGFEIINQFTGCERLLKEQNIDLLITGEGQLNVQSLMGKLPVQVARLAKKYGAATMAIVGTVGEDIGDTKEIFDNIYSLCTNGISSKYSMSHAIPLLKETLLKITL